MTNSTCFSSAYINARSRYRSRVVATTSIWVICEHERMEHQRLYAAFCTAGELHFMQVWYILALQTAGQRIRSPWRLERRTSARLNKRSRTTMPAKMAQLYGQ